MERNQRKRKVEISESEETEDENIEDLELENEPETEEEDINNKEDNNISKLVEELGFSFNKEFTEKLPFSSNEFFNGSPKKIPNSVKSEFNMWNLYFPHSIIQNWVKETNKWLKDHNIKKRRGNSNSEIISIDPQDMINYWMLEFATAMVYMKKLRWYWRVNNTEEQLLGNNFFKNVMSVDKFLMIRRSFQCNINDFMVHYNRTSQKYWNLGESICIDDDLDKIKASFLSNLAAHTSDRLKNCKL